MDINGAIYYLKDDFEDVKYSHFNGECHYFTGICIDDHEPADIEMEEKDDKVIVSYRYPNTTNTWYHYQVLVND